MVTRRHQSDMSSDSWLSKNIRPLTLIALVILFAALSFMKADEYIIEEVTMLLHTLVMFYVGSRGIEKISTIRQRNNEIHPDS